MTTTTCCCTAAGGLDCAGCAEPMNAARVGAILAIDWICALSSAVLGSRTATRLTGCDCANAAGGTAVTAFGARMFTKLICCVTGAVALVTFETYVLLITVLLITVLLTLT